MIAQIAEELGINRETPHSWIRKGDDQHPTQAATPTRTARSDTAPTATQSLQEENQRLRAQVAELTTEREILRKTAAYFAGEMKP